MFIYGFTACFGGLFFKATIMANIEKLQEDILRLQSALLTQTNALNYFKDLNQKLKDDVIYWKEQNAKLQRALAIAESKQQLYKNTMPFMEAPSQDLPPLTKEDY
jgi:CMP-N-acetylneuraminic acid synthetase